MQFSQWNETAQGLDPQLMRASHALWLLLEAVTLHQRQIWCLLVSTAEVKLSEVPQSTALYSV